MTGGLNSGNLTAAMLVIFPGLGRYAAPPFFGGVCYVWGLVSPERLHGAGSRIGPATQKPAAKFPLSRE